MFNPVTKIAALIVALAVAALGAYIVSLKHDLAQARAELAEVKAAHAQERETLEREARIALDAARQIEQQRAEAHRKEIENARIQMATAQRDRDAARSALQRLRNAAAQAAAASGGDAPGDPATAEGSSTIAGPGLVLADVLVSSSSRLVDMAAALDESRRAGSLCERLYDSLTPNPSN